MITGYAVGLTHIYTKNTYDYATCLFSVLSSSASAVALSSASRVRTITNAYAVSSLSRSRQTMSARCTDIYHVSTTLQMRIANKIHASGKGSIKLDIIEYTPRATMDIIVCITFGDDFNAVGDAPDALKIADTWRAQNEMVCKHAAFMTICVLSLSPWITSLPPEAIQAQGAVANTIRELARNIIASSEIDKKGKGKDLMYLMLKANAHQDESRRCGISEICEYFVTFV